MSILHGVEKNLGEQLRAYRKARKMNQTELAMILNISTAYVSKLEKNQGEPNFHLRQKIVELLSEDKNAEPAPSSDRGKPAETYGGYIEAVAAMMREMDVETQKDIFLSVQKEKLLRELLTEREEKKIG